MELYDVRGQRVRRLVDRAGEPGRFSVVWNGADEDGRRVGAGIYLVRFAAGPYSLTGRLVRLGP